MSICDIAGILLHKGALLPGDDADDIADNVVTSGGHTVRHLSGGWMQRQNV
jgi:hypothetical protein